MLLSFSGSFMRKNSLRKSDLPENHLRFSDITTQNDMTAIFI